MVSWYGNRDWSHYCPNGIYHNSVIVDMRTFRLDHHTITHIYGHWTKVFLEELNWWIVVSHLSLSWESSCAKELLRLAGFPLNFHFWVSIHSRLSVFPSTVQWQLKMDISLFGTIMSYFIYIIYDDEYRFYLFIFWMLLNKKNIIILYIIIMILSIIAYPWQYDVCWTLPF